MRILIESTGDLYGMNGTLTRRWVGTTEDGSQCQVFVAAIGVVEEDNTPELEAALAAIGDPFSGDVRKMWLPERKR